MNLTTTENEWLCYLKQLPQWMPPILQTIILSPHPDDETLGSGGLIADLRYKNIEVNVIAITDGENAYTNVHNLREIRQIEQEQALYELGVPKEKIIRLKMTDSALQEKQVEEKLLPFINNHCHLLAPWTGDFHSDHETVGRVATNIAKRTGACLSYYFFWTWHHVPLSNLKHLPLKRYPISFVAYRAKQKALDCYQSQLKQPNRPSILSRNLLKPIRRAFEVYLPYEI